MKSLIFIAAFFLATCNSTKNMATDAELAGNWELVMMPGTGKDFAEIFLKNKPEVQFDVNEKKFGGTTGCNRFSVNYERDNASFRFAESIMMTKMACPGYDENVFVEALKNVDNIVLRNNQLHFRQDTTLVMAFARAES